MLNLSLEAFGQSIPTNKEAEIWHGFACEYFPKFDITTNNRIAGFMAQGGHESQDFRAIIENLNYSASGLRNTFGRYFKSDAMAREYERQPSKIANYVYADANRINKLGNVQDGDGWRFRGSGIMMLTGRWMYKPFSEYVAMTMEDTAAYVRTKRGAFESACWVWKNKNGNAYCDKKDITGMSRAINGGNIGLDDRKVRWNRNLRFDYILQETIFCPPFIQKGARGYEVAVIQRTLKSVDETIVDDGHFGTKTEKAVREWQRKEGHPVTGKLTSDEVMLLWPYLQRGSRGKDVETAQSQLKKLGFKIDVDARFGPAMYEVVREWQTKQEFEVTGVLTPDQLKTLCQGV